MKLVLPHNQLIFNLSCQADVGYSNLPANSLHPSGHLGEMEHNRSCPAQLAPDAKTEVFLIFVYSSPL